jgi:DNA-binding CsgD family transcriptional regulator
MLCQVLVGRDGEASLLLEALARARAGRGGVVLLAGEPGIGKSRLAREAANAARQQGSVVLVGRAVNGAAPTPFRPFAEALAAPLRPGRLPADADLDPFRPALGRLAPQLLPSHHAHSEDSLVFLGEAVIRLLRLLSPDAGSLLVLEDLHWADQETLALLEYVADNLLAEPVLCVGTFRPDEGEHIAELAAKLESRGSADVLQLRPLEAHAVTSMTKACLGTAGFPPPVRDYLCERAEGNPFLVEELLAGLIEEGVLHERDGQWHTTGQVTADVPDSFADEVGRRLDAMDPESQRVIGAASVIGRRFEWSLLGQVTGASDSVVLSALRRAVDLQLVATGANGFRFRHALTHAAVLGALLPPELAQLAGAALVAVQATQPGLPDAWCVLAADLAERAGDSTRAGELLLEAGQRDIAIGALATAEQTLTRARALAPAGDTELRLGVDEALTELYALSGQVERAMETGHRLLARLGRSAARSAGLHVMIAEAAINGGRWEEAAASLTIARQIPHPEMSRVDVCAAQLAEELHQPEEAMRLARSALAAAEASELPDVACQALEVIGRLLRFTDLDEAERAFARGASTAAAHGLGLLQVRALTELGSIDVVRTGSVDRLSQSRELAASQGALFLTAVLDLQLTAGLLKQCDGDEALVTASRCVAQIRRFRLAGLPEALIFQAAAHALRHERDEMEAKVAEATALAPSDVHVRASAWGRCRAVISLLDEEPELGLTHLETGADLLLTLPGIPAAPFLGLWPLVGAALDRDVTADLARLRTEQHLRTGVVGGLLHYADAILAGRAGKHAEASAAVDAGDAELGPLLLWYRSYGRRIMAQAALADGWGDPVGWLREAGGYFADRGDDRVAAACRQLIRKAGAPVPRRRPADADLPQRLRAASISSREADVLEMVADGMTNREIADRMFLSPRTVEKHVASLLIKTGVRRRAQLAGYFAQLDK